MSASDLTVTPSAVTHSPDRKSDVPTMVETRMLRSTILPKNAAPMPRKKMPSENANCTSFCVEPMAFAISVEKFVNA